LHVANTRAYPPPPAPRHLLAMSHVLDDNVASENRGGRRNFGRLKTSHSLGRLWRTMLMCAGVATSMKFEEVARALNEDNALPWNSNGNLFKDRYKLLLENL
jgi:hypothetical protein